MVNSEEEQTFRPTESAQKRKSYQVSQRQVALLKSHQVLFHDQHEDPRDERRLRNYKEVMSKREKQPYQEYVRDLEAETRAEFRKSRIPEQGERLTYNSQPPPQRQNTSPSLERVEQKAPLPEALPRLLAHESGNIDLRYFENLPLNSEESGGILSQRTGQTSTRFDKNGNLVSCLRQRQRGNLNSAREQAGALSPSDPRVKIHIPSVSEDSHLRRPKSHSTCSGERTGQFKETEKYAKKFKQICSPSSASHKKRRQDQVSPQSSVAQRRSNTLNVASFEHKVQMERRRDRSQERDNRRHHQIHGFEVVHQIHSQMLHQTRQGAPLSTERDRGNYEPKRFQRHAPQPSGQSGNLHNTQRSMGIESYCQRKEEAKMQEVADYGAIAEIQEKSETLRQQLDQNRRNRQEIEDNKTALIALKGENHLLRKQIEQKEMALMGLRDQNGQQKKKIDELQSRVDYLQGEVDTAGDQQLFRRYKEVLAQKEEVAQKLASVEFSIEANKQSHDLMKRSYESLKDNQLQLVEMNKKLIKQHQEEAEKLQQEMAATSRLLDEKNHKLHRYAEVIKSFDAQIAMFEDFQERTSREIEQLRSQVKLFQGLFEKEKLDREELVRKMRPSQRPIHDSLKKQLAGQLHSYQSQDRISREWEQRNSGFDSQKNSEQLQVESSAFDSIAERRRDSAEQVKLTQTMSKNLSFGQPFLPDSIQLGSGHGGKDKYRIDSEGNAAFGSRRNTHFVDLPLQILSETSSDDAKYAGEKPKAQWSHDANRNGKADVKSQYYQSRPPRHDTQSTVNMRPHENDSYIGSNLESEEPLPDQQHCQPPSEPEHLIARGSWGARLQQRSSSQNHQMQAQNSLPKLVSHSESHPTNITHQGVTLVNQAKAANDLDISGYSMTSNLQRIDKKKLGFETEEQESNERRLNGCQSAFVGHKMLNFKKPDAASSNNSQKQGNRSTSHSQPRPVYASQTVTACSQNVDRKTKMKPMSPKDYYCRLREMQRRLDRARCDISKNVERSRSKSPVNLSQFQPSEKTMSSAVSAITTNAADGLQHTHTLANQNQKDCKADNYRPYTVASQSKSGCGSASGRSLERRKEISKPQAKGSKSRSGLSQGSHQKHTQPLFYTSLYNGVQPLYK